jgi:phosphoglycerate dehydrogenase-like enzyme
LNQPADVDPKVLLIDPALGPLVPRFAEQLPDGVAVAAVSTFDDAEFARLAADATVLVNARRIVDAALLQAAPNVRLVQMIGAGIDPIDRAAAAAAGVAVAYNPGVNTTGAAEHTVMLMLALLKGIQASEVQTRAGGFAPGPMIARGIDDLADATVGLVGMGRIGRAVVERIAPFGPRIVYTARRPAADVEERLGAQRLALDELLRTATVVSLHIPLTAETRGMIGAGELASMPRGAYLINAGRGGLVDEAALRAAIESGHLAGAALDVIEGEADGVNPFADLPQVIVTPHLGGASRNSMRNTVDRCTANVRRFLAGEPLADQVVLTARP